MRARAHTNTQAHGEINNNATPYFTRYLGGERVIARQDYD